MGRAKNNPTAQLAKANMIPPKPKQPGKSERDADDLRFMTMMVYGAMGLHPALVPVSEIERGQKYEGRKND